jgi:hypothetical protein
MDTAKAGCSFANEFSFEVKWTIGSMSSTGQDECVKSQEQRAWVSPPNGQKMHRFSANSVPGGLPLSTTALPAAATNRTDG